MKTKNKTLTVLIIFFSIFYFSSCSTFKAGSYTVITSRFRCGKSIVTFKEVGGEWVIPGKINKNTSITINKK